MQRLLSIGAIVQALLVGFVAAAVFAVGGFAIASRVLVSAFIAPGVFVIGLVGRLIPPSITYSIFPEGGGPAFFGFSFVVAAVFWVCAFAVLFVLARRLRGANKA